MILLFTDFGYHGPYVGEMKAAIAHVLGNQASAVPVIDLMHDAPAFRPDLAAYLLASLVATIPAKATVVAVIDPGVGTDRVPVTMEADGRTFIGPGNGLFEIVKRRATSARLQRLLLPDRPLSASFHGRDLFAPAAAKRALAGTQATAPLTDSLPGSDWPDDLGSIIYVDHYGNAMTGLRADTMGPDAHIHVNGRCLPCRRTYGEAAPGELFWYRNSNDLVELAAREASAAAMLDLRLGDPVTVGSSE